MANMTPSSAFRLEPVDADSLHPGHFAIPGDRMSPAVAGAIAGALGGAAALGMVHGLATERFLAGVLAAATARGVDAQLSLGIAYATAAALGAIVGAGFAAVTRYLRKWVPLLVWAVVFFASLTLLIMAGATLRGIQPGVLTVPILAASLAYALIVSFSLPIRRRD